MLAFQFKNTLGKNKFQNYKDANYKKGTGIKAKSIIKPMKHMMNGYRAFDLMRKISLKNDNKNIFA